MERKKKFKFGMLTCGEVSEGTVKAHFKNAYEVKRYATDKRLIEKDLAKSMLVINRAIRDIKETMGEITKTSGYCHQVRTPSPMSVSDASSLSNNPFPHPFSEEAIKHSKHNNLISVLESSVCRKNNGNSVKQPHRCTVTSNSPVSGYQCSDLREERYTSGGTSVSPSQSCGISPSPKTSQEKDVTFRGKTPTCFERRASRLRKEHCTVEAFQAGTGKCVSETSGVRQCPTPKLESEYNSDVMDPDSTVFSVPVITFDGDPTRRSEHVTHMNESDTVKTTQYISSKMKARGQSHQVENSSPLANQNQLAERLLKHNPAQENIRNTRTSKLRSKSAASMSYTNCVRDQKEFKPGTPKSLGDVDCINSRQTDNTRRLREGLVRSPAYSFGTRDSARVIMSKSAIQRNLKRMTLEYNKPRSMIHLEKERQTRLHDQVIAFVNLMFMDCKNTL